MSELTVLQLVKVVVVSSCPIIITVSPERLLAGGHFHATHRRVSLWSQELQGHSHGTPKCSSNAHAHAIDDRASLDIYSGLHMPVTITNHDVELHPLPHNNDEEDKVAAPRVVYCRLGSTATEPQSSFPTSHRRLIKTAFVAAVFCCGVPVGIFLLLLVQSFTSPPLPASGPPPPTPPSIPSNGSSAACPNASDVSPLIVKAFVPTFFNISCIAAGHTGDVCDVHLANEYTRAAFAELRVDHQVVQVISFAVMYGLAQLGGIPRATSARGAIFWLLWMGTQLAQWLLTFYGLLFLLVRYFSVRAKLEPCLVTTGESQLALLDYYAQLSFAAQPDVLTRLMLLFACTVWGGIEHVYLVILTGLDLLPTALLDSLLTEPRIQLARRQTPSCSTSVCSCWTAAATGHVAAHTCRGARRRRRLVARPAMSSSPTT